nr:hypothetical protein BaRGS_006112 [Batillaria attramentaria]
MLVVAVEKDNKVHVVDHTDGCLFVRYLNTEPFTLDRPRCLATDYNHRLWIGCHGGKACLQTVAGTSPSFPCPACRTPVIVPPGGVGALQCKLTSHEGHPTEDLEDAGAKVKAKIQQMLKNAEQQKALLDGVLAAADHESKRLQELGRKMEEEIRNRKQVLDQWSTQAADQAVESVHATVEMNISCLQERTQQVRDQQAAVVAQQGHLTRVLDSDIDADIVSLEAQLSEVTVDRGKLLKLQEKLKEEAADIMCKHNPGAINLSDMMAFVGVLEKRASEETSTCIDGREMLVVAVERNNAVHVVDHTDGCLFVRYLNTEPFTLDRPCCLATDYNHRLWIGCHGGKVILVVTGRNPTWRAAAAGWPLTDIPTGIYFVRFFVIASLPVRRADAITYSD